MKINAYAMLKTLLFTLQNGKNISSGMLVLAKSARTKRERKTYLKIYDDIKEGSTFSQALSKNNVGSLDMLSFIAMAEQSASFRIALQKLIKYLEVKDEFQRESNDKVSLPVIYFGIATIIVFGIKFFAVPYQIQRAQGYSKEIVSLIAEHLQMAQVMTDALFVGLVVVGSYFMILLLSLFNNSYYVQGVAKQLALLLPFSAAIVMKFEKFMLFGMLGEMLQSGISFKKAILSAIETTTVTRFKKALHESLESIRTDGKFILHSRLYDDVEQALLVGAGSSSQIGAVMLEISDRSRTDALELSTKFFRMITLLSILLMAFAVFIEFYTVVLTQILIQKGLIDAARGVGSF